MHVEPGQHGSATPPQITHLSVELLQTSPALQVAGPPSDVQHASPVAPHGPSASAATSTRSDVGGSATLVHATAKSAVATIGSHRARKDNFAP